MLTGEQGMVVLCMSAQLAIRAFRTALSSVTLRVRSGLILRRHR
jgi:hypothetical protein